MSEFPWKALAIGGVVLGAVGALAFTGSHSPPNPPSRVALIGDSYAVGLGKELAKLLPNFRVAGCEGSNTYEWANHIAHNGCSTSLDWLTTFKPDVVLVSLGVNDGAPNSANYQAIVRTLHGLGARVVWIEPPAAVTTQSIPAVRSAIASLGVATVPATETLLASDGLHPKNYAPWAQEIAETLKENTWLTS